MTGNRYESAPPAPGWHPPLLNGRPMSGRYALWPDQRPLPSTRDVLLAVGFAILMMVAPFVIDALTDTSWRDWAMFSALGLAFVGQAGMDVARPDPDSRVGVTAYRTIYVGLPFIAAAVVLVFGGFPFLSQLSRRNTVVWLPSSV